MADQDQQRSDPLGDVINLIAAPIAGGIRQFEQLRRGVDELFRAVENVNATMANLNEAASRLNRLMSDVEEPIRSMIPQITRTVKAADEIVDLLGGPARRVAPNLERITDTLGSPAFTSLPHQLNEALGAMGELSRRLTPLTQLAESAGGLLGLRIPGLMRPAAGPRPSTSAASAGGAAPTGTSAPSMKPTPPAKKASKPAKKAASKSTARRKKTGA